jgi:hypothetical protein
MADKSVSNHCCPGGINSRKMSKSTGTPPPAPIPASAQNAQHVSKFGDAAAAQQKIPDMNRVMLKAGLEVLEQTMGS